jgi:CRISPR-associated protein Csy1
VSSEFRDSTVGGYFLRWITDLPRDRFHVSTFHTGPSTDDLTREFERGSDRFAQVSGNADVVARAVRKFGVDVAVLLDVGMSAKSMLLANLRLARVQCAAWGHPVTTGSASVDYFSPARTMEPPDAQAHYSESASHAPGIGVRYRAAPADAFSTRAQFGLPTTGTSIFVPSRCARSTRTTTRCSSISSSATRGADRAFRRAVDRADGGFCEAAGRGAARSRRAAPAAIQVRARMSRAQFLGVMAVSDVMIDTLRWSGGNTTLDALSTWLPIVTLEGELMRGRQTAAMLRILGLEELIAADRDDYLARRSQSRERPALP